MYNIRNILLLRTGNLLKIRCLAKFWKGTPVSFVELMSERVTVLGTMNCSNAVFSSYLNANIQKKEKQLVPEHV